eukprot:TRINITY_DN3804_c0_g1_i1.p1 TRINITY_DN3804_c0_g1~~TRINITY_DN3804_c0_g1_i1.p1  ORF type:complete len:685 (+),score=113.83 TRINITY_DN3804_c0_g1_i1:103-2055(+)
MALCHNACLISCAVLATVLPCCYASRPLALAEEAKQRRLRLLHHPGHVSEHVTRLHRYDHSGLDVFLEREAEWHSGKMVNTSAGEHRFLGLSAAQQAELRDHHHAWVQMRYFKSNASGHSARGARYSDRTEQLTRPNEQQAAALKRFAQHHIGGQNKQAVTGLSSLSSQYVGPIGVGTMLQPTGCNVPADSLLALKIEEARTEPARASTGDKDNVQVCQSAEQSNVWVVFDSGSTNIWVSSDLCENGPCAKPERRRYNHTQSITFNHPAQELQLTVDFGTGRLIGPQAVDDFHIGPFTTFQQTFGMIETQNGSVFSEVPFEGILGLAFPAMSANGVTPFFDNVIKQKVLKRNEFAFYLSKLNPSANAIFWGGVDKRFYEGDIQYFPVTDPYYWSIDLHAFMIGDECLLGQHCQNSLVEAGDTIDSSDVEASLQEQPTERKRGRRRRPAQVPAAILDTGTTYFTAESDLFEEVMSRIPHVSCKEISDDSHPPITYILKNAAGKLSKFTFTNSQYMTEADGECSPAFMRIDIPAQHGPAMVLGEVFLRHYFAVFDRGDGEDTSARVGLAKSVHSEDTMKYLRKITHAQPTFDEARASRIALKNAQTSEEAPPIAVDAFSSLAQKHVATASAARLAASLAFERGGRQRQRRKL